MFSIRHSKATKVSNNLIYKTLVIYIPVYSPLYILRKNPVKMKKC